ncbi:rhomboid family intramembrane serine protease [Rhodanobacter sp. MP1X3]|uniref:rhomboid family intramembrane serine protease n=1 Tax=Rhodanobacter sp. MP1X3 TaxID=2723086 RepID=UPI00161B9BB7|nr:rhomboid family intramembrane serine protease [Rhodanobacter sp. MP1X3]MBB6242407.1 rhomboid protease GluP [Rhodanobacter sp. MP1X3]
MQIGETDFQIYGKRRRPFWFGLQEKHCFPLDALFNVARDGNSFHIMVRSDREKKQFIKFSTNSRLDAGEIENLLPSEQTPEFAKARLEESDFHQRLDRLSPRAPVTLIIIAINLIVFAAMCIGGVGVFDADSNLVMKWGSNYGPMTMGGQWWRLFTSMFVHFGIIHIALNMFVLFQNGRMIERLFGSFRFILLYVFAGLAGSMVSLLWNPEVNSAGASGAIFGLIGGLLVFVLNPRNRVPKAVVQEHRNSTLLFVGYNLFYGFAHTGIDNGAHIGGLVAGLAMGFLLARPLDLESRAKSDVNRVLMATGSGALALGLMMWPLKNPSATTEGDLQFRSALTAVGPQNVIAINATNRLNDKARAGAISTKEFAAELETDVVPKWELPYNEIAAAKLGPQDSNYPLQQAMLRYLGGRRNSLRLVAEAIDKNDDRLMQQAEEETKDAAAALADIQTINHAKK